MAMVAPEGFCNRWQKESDKPQEELDLQKYLMHLKRRGIPFISMEKDKKVTITPAHREYKPAIFNENGKRC